MTRYGNELIVLIIFAREGVATPKWKGLQPPNGRGCTPNGRGCNPQNGRGCNPPMEGVAPRPEYPADKPESEERCPGRERLSNPPYLF